MSHLLTNLSECVLGPSGIDRTGDTGGGGGGVHHQRDKLSTSLFMSNTRTKTLMLQKSTPVATTSFLTLFVRITLWNKDCHPTWRTCWARSLDFLRLFSCTWQWWLFLLASTILNFQQNHLLRVFISSFWMNFSGYSFYVSLQWWCFSKFCPQSLLIISLVVFHVTSQVHNPSIHLVRLCSGPREDE